MKPTDTAVAPGAEIRHRLPPLKALTALRFFAAIYVVVYHLASRRSLVGVVAAENFISSGDTGVSLFFILSGFILAYNYWKIDHLREFWISRFARIYPVYLFALLLSFAYSFAPASREEVHRWLRFVLTAGLLQAWYQPFSDSFNGPGWTLSVEAFFYAVFPLALRGMGRVNGRVFASCCAIYIAFLCVPALLPGAGDQTYAAALAVTMTNCKFPVYHLPLFLFGVWLGMNYRRRQASLTTAGPGTARWLHVTPYLAALGSVALLCIGPAGVYEPARRGLLALCYAALIFGLAPVRRGPLTSRWMVLAGEISFSIYILQMPVFRSVFGLVRPLHLGPYTEVSMALAALITVSYLGYRFIELPARVAIRRRLTHRPVPLVSI